MRYVMFVGEAYGERILRQLQRLVIDAIDKLENAKIKITSSIA